MMMEVVRQEPNLPDPYHLLGMLHEAVGNEKKALDFFMIAAHITAQARHASWRGLVREKPGGLTGVSLVGRPRSTSQGAARPSDRALPCRRMRPAPPMVGHRLHCDDPCLNVCRMWTFGAAWPKARPSWGC